MLIKGVSGNSVEECNMKSSVYECFGKMVLLRGFLMNFQIPILGMVQLQEIGQSFLWFFFVIV